MHVFTRFSLCFAVLFALGVFATFAGTALELAARSSEFSTRHYLNGRPLPWLTEGIFKVGFPHQFALFVLVFYPVLGLSAYLWCLLRSKLDPVEAHVRFALAALVAFITMASLLVLGVATLALPFLPLCLGLAGPTPRVSLLQQFIFSGGLGLLIINGLLFIWMLAVLRSRRNLAMN